MKLFSLSHKSDLQVQQLQQSGMFVTMKVRSFTFYVLGIPVMSRQISYKVRPQKMYSRVY